MLSSKRFGLVLLIAATGLIAGCEASVSTGGDEIDADDAAKTIQSQYPSQADGLKLTEISCDSTDAEVDATFDCTAKNDAGVSLDIKGTINEVNKDTDNIKFDWTITKAVSDGKAYSDVAVTTLQKQGYAVESMECPEFEIKTGVKVDCDVTMDDGSSQTATITLTNDNGGFDVVTSGPTG